MPTVADVLRRYGEQYLERFGATMPGEHKKVLRAISACRTGELGRCSMPANPAGPCTWSADRVATGTVHLPAREDPGLAREADRPPPAMSLLPGNLHAAGRTARIRPEPSAGDLLRAVRSLQRSSAPWRPTPSSSAPIALASSVSCNLGPNAGVPPARALRRARAVDRREWQSLAAVVRRLPGAGEGAVHPVPGQVPRHPEAQGLLDQVAPAAWQRDWVVHFAGCRRRPGVPSLSGPYVFRVAIGNHRIVSCDEQSYLHLPSRRIEPAAQDDTGRHGVPSPLPPARPACGFQKVRHYGFLSPNSGTSIEAVRWLVTLHNGALFVLLAKRPEEPAAQPTPPCPACGCPMVVRDSYRLWHHLIRANPMTNVKLFETVPAWLCDVKA